MALVTVVLVEPQTPANVGMVCRAMANFGVEHLRLVNPCDHRDDMARRLAVDASPLLDRAEVFDTLEAALADQHITVATTRRKGRHRGDLVEARDFAARVREMPAETRLALVFGREDSGLTLSEVELCQEAATIATSEQLASLNLAQAVLLFSYELPRTQATPAAKGGLPSHADTLALDKAVEELLGRIGFLNPQRPDAIMQPLRRLLSRAAPDLPELNLLRSMFAQLDNSAKDWPGKRRGTASNTPSAKRRKSED